MHLSFILLVFSALLISFLVGFFQYYFKVNSKSKITPILFVLKVLSLFLLLLLLINPKINNTKISDIKPVLSLLVDDSKSVDFFKEGKNVQEFIKFIDGNKELQNKFDIQKFTFGNDLKVLDSLTFSKSQTNIYEAISGTNNLQKDKIAPILLISDGNQTIGEDYEFVNSKQPVYPIIIGDTTKYIDIKISRLNVNKYSYLKNKFPVEVILNYEGDKKVTTQFSIFKEGKTVFKKNVSFSSNKKSVTITTNLMSSKEGIQYYSATIAKLNKEKNINNNTKSFSVEVIDEQTKILLLTSILHPDLGVFKKSIESNKQRSVEIKNINNNIYNILDYQLVILYQPNNKFNKIISQLISNNSNYLIVSGTKTDWNFINQQKLGFRKNAINESENYGAVYNDSYLTFLQEDLGFDNFPPLKDKYGEVSIYKEHQTLLYQNINGVKTRQPLLTTFDINNQKSAVLFGEEIWKWRARNFLNSNSFEDFDKFIGNLVQFLASNKKRKRLGVNIKAIYPANSTINISAFYNDKNYQFDSRANLELTIYNSEAKEVLKIPLSLVNNSFQTDIENLTSGDYTYEIKVLNQKISKKGQFKITDYQVEEQFTNANVKKLQKMANKTGGKHFYINQVEEITELLLENEAFFTVQKSTKKQQNLIDWKWILILAILLYTIEWFLRKYYGKI